MALHDFVDLENLDSIPSPSEKSEFCERPFIQQIKTDFFATIDEKALAEATKTLKSRFRTNDTLTPLSSLKFEYPHWREQLQLSTLPATLTLEEAANRLAGYYAKEKVLEDYLPGSAQYDRTDAAIDYCIRPNIPDNLRAIPHVPMPR